MTSIISSHASVEERIKAFKDVYLAESPTPSALGEGVYTAHPLIPPGSRVYITTKRNGSSIVDKYGVRVTYPIEDSTVCRCRWFCLLDDCYNAGHGSKIKISRSSTHKATRHLSKRHGILSPKTIAAASNASRLNQLIGVSAPGFHQSPSRFYQIQFATWAAEHSIAFNAFKGDSWNIIANTLPAHDPEVLSNLDAAKHQLEQYLVIKQKLISTLQEARRFYRGVPFLSFNVDLYQNSILNMKFIAIRLSWTMHGHIHSKNIGVRLYNPSYTEREYVHASDLLLKWSKGLLNEFSVDIEADVYTSIGDGGSDVRCVMRKLTSSLREWCLGHILNLCLVDAFGAHHDKSKSKNLEARRVIESVRKMIEHINKSSKLKTKLEEILIDVLGHVVKLKNSPHHRWAAIEDVLSRVLQQWTPLMQAYAALIKPFPLKELRVVISEFYSLLVPLRKLQVKTQAMRKLTCVSSYLTLVQLFIKTLDENSPLAILRPDFGDEPVEIRNTRELDPRTIAVRKLLREALFTRYFYRYHPIKALVKWRDFYGKEATKNGETRTIYTVTLNDFRADYIFELQSMLHPRSRKLGPLMSCVYKIPIETADYPEGFPEELKDTNRLRTQFIKLLEAALWKHIRDTLTKIHSTTIRAPRHTQFPPAKRMKLCGKFDDIWDYVPNSQATSTGSVVDFLDDEEVEPLNPVELAQDEVTRYRTAQYDILECSDPEHLLQWWWEDKQRGDFVALPKLAGCLLAMKPGTGGLECDIGGVGDVVAPKRGSISPGLIEVAMMIKLNRDGIQRDSSKVPRLGRDWRDFIPGREEYPDGYFDLFGVDGVDPNDVARTDAFFESASRDSDESVTK